MTLIVFTLLPLSTNTQIAQLSVLAADADPVTWLFNLGTAGVWLACNLTGLQPSRPEVTRLVTENDELKAERDAARAETARERAEKDSLRDQLMRSLPTFAHAATSMVQQAVPIMQQADAQQAQVAQTLAVLLARAEKVLGDGGDPDGTDGTDAGRGRG